MDCQDMQKNEYHEKYILSQLTDSEKADFEKHLSGCKFCQQELESQRVLISGIRAVGLHEMKEEIRRQVEAQQPGSQVSWARYAKIAAVFFVCVVTPALYFFFRAQNPEFAPMPAEQIRLPEEEVVVSEPKKTKRLDVEDLQPGAKRERSLAQSEVKVSPPLSDVPKAGISPSSVQTERLEAPADVKDLLLSKTDYGEVLKTYRYRLAKRAPKVSTQFEQTLIMSEARPRVLEFHSNGDVIRVQLRFSSEQIMKEESVLPASFPVNIVTQDSIQLEIQWTVPPDFAKVNLEAALLQVSPEQIMRIILKDNLVYTVDLKSDSTQAVLEK